MSARLPPRTDDAARTATLAVIASFACGTLLEVDRLPPWCTALALALSGWRAAGEFRRLGRPGRFVRGALALVAMTTVVLQFRTLNGLEAGTALLAVMGAFKLFELDGRRDRLIVVGVSLFLLLAACLGSQSLLRAPLYLGELVLTCTALALAGMPRPGLGLAAASRLALRSLGAALPLALLLFVFFPRIAGSFWALPTSGDALTGLGDEMSPGQIDRLTESDDPAFRVRFDGPVPQPILRYWRGPVLHSFDGTTWRRESGLGTGSALAQQALDYVGPVYHYRISLEPHQRHWLFALERAVPPGDRGVYFTFDYQLLSSEPVTQSIAYELSSFPDARSTVELAEGVRRLETHQPPKRNPRAQALAAELRAGAASDGAFANAVLAYFGTHGFTYTLTPPQLERDAVDDFLFRTRRGFCGHYASAFAALMRAGGVPARVVTGYLGGEWNQVGGYFIVRQSDAHAWVEIWLAGRGWTRVDPTGVVAPERLTQSLFELMPGAMSTRSRLMHRGDWVSHARLAWDAADSWWRDHVQGYDLRRQLALLEQLGFVAPAAADLAIFVAGGLAAWLLWLGWRMRHSLRGPDRDPLALEYERLCARLAAAGLPRLAQEGPLAYAERIAVLRPDLAERVRILCGLYARLRFGPPRAAGATGPDVAGFRRAARAFRPGRQAASSPVTGSLRPRAVP